MKVTFLNLCKVGKKIDFNLIYIYLIFFILVCISVLTKFAASLPKEDAKDMQKINKAFTVFCKDLKLKENRFVSNIHFCTFKKMYVYYTEISLMYLYLSSVITSVEQMMLRQEYWVKCPNPCLGECQLKKFVRS